MFPIVWFPTEIEVNVLCIRVRADHPAEEEEYLEHAQQRLCGDVGPLRHTGERVDNSVCKEVGQEEDMWCGSAAPVLSA